MDWEQNNAVLEISTNLFTKTSIPVNIQYSYYKYVIHDTAHVILKNIFRALEARELEFWSPHSPPPKKNKKSARISEMSLNKLGENHSIPPVTLLV